MRKNTSNASRSVTHNNIYLSKRLPLFQNIPKRFLKKRSHAQIEEDQTVKIQDEQLPPKIPRMSVIVPNPNFVARLANHAVPTDTSSKQINEALATDNNEGITAVNRLVPPIHSSPSSSFLSVEQADDEDRMKAQVTPPPLPHHPNLDGSDNGRGITAVAGVASPFFLSPSNNRTADQAIEGQILDTADVSTQQINPIPFLPDNTAESANTDSFSAAELEPDADVTKNHIIDSSATAGSPTQPQNSVEPTSDDSPFTVLSETSESAEKLGVFSKTTIIRINPADIEREQHFLRALENLSAKAREAAGPQDFINFSIENTHQSEHAVILDFGNRESINPEAILYKVSLVMQSNKNFSTDGALRITVKVVKNRVGGHPGTDAKENIAFLQKTSVVTSKCNNVHHESTKDWQRMPYGQYRAKTVKKNNFCLPYAIVTGLKYLEIEKGQTEEERKKRKLQFKEFAHQRTKEFAKITDELMKKAGVNLLNRLGDYEDLKRFDSVIDCSIVVYDFTEGKQQIFFDSREKNFEAPVLYLILKDQHFDFLKAPQPFFQARLKCDTCNKGIAYGRSHVCLSECIRCHTRCTAKEQMTERIHCTSCNLHFKSQMCFEQHKNEPKPGEQPRCRAVRKCKNCCLVYLTDKDAHTCDFKFCRVCDKRVPHEHACYFSKDIGSADTDIKRMKNTLLVYFDTETMTDEVSGAHKVCVLCCESLCVQCRATETDNCVFCGKRAASFDCLDNVDADPVADFLEYVHCKTAPKKVGKHRVRAKNAIVLSHYGSRFDTVLVVRSAIMSKKWRIETILNNGRKYTKLVLRHKISQRTLTFLDTYCFVSKCLADLPSAFSVENLNKGTFPFAYVKPQNFGKVLDTLPELRYYEPDLMSEKKREKLLTWYREEKEAMKKEKRKFVFNEDILNYCKLDVKILKLCFEKFCAQMSALGIEPLLSKCHTLAMVTFKLYRRRFMPENSIGWNQYKET